MDIDAILRELTCGGYTSSDAVTTETVDEEGFANFGTWATPTDEDADAEPWGRVETDGLHAYAMAWTVKAAPVEFTVGICPAILAELGEMLESEFGRAGASSQSIEDVTIAYADWSPQTLLAQNSLYSAAVRKWSLCDTSGSVSYQFDEDKVRGGSTRLW